VTPTPPSQQPSAARKLARRLPAPIRRAGRSLLSDRSETAEVLRPSLDEIGIRTGTDKSSELHDYLATYESAFRHLRDEPIQLLEIGVHKGSSIRMWEEYFPRAQLFGVDISPACRQYASDRISILIGDQSRTAFLERLAKKLRPTIVIDDGSHVWSHQIETLQKLLPVVRPGGFFVVEDIHTSFGEDYAKVYGRGSGETAFDYVSRIAESITAGTRAGAPSDDFDAYCRRTVESVQFIKNSAIFRKKAFPQRKYRVRSVAELSDAAKTRDAGGSYSRRDAELVDASPEILAAFEALRGEGVVSVPQAVSAELADVRVVGNGLALTRDGKIVDETLNCARNLTRGSGMFQVVKDQLWVNEVPIEVHERVPAQDGRHHVLLKQTWDANYGHWMIDTLPKVGLLRDVADLSTCTFVLNEQSTPAMRRVVEDSLGLFGITPDQLMFLDRATYEFERLIVLGHLTRHPVSKSPLAIEVLEEAASAVEPREGARRIYLTRHGVSRRRLVNEPEVLEALAEHGYEVVATEDLSVRDQIATFRSASHVIGVMGAAMSNLAFSPRGVSVLALATEAMKHDFFYDIVSLKEGRYRGLQGAAVAPPADIAADFTVDIAHLHDSLAWLHGDAR